MANAEIAWFSTDDVVKLTRSAKQWDIIELEHRNEEQCFKWALVINISENDVEIVHSSRDNKLHTKYLSDVICNCSVRINNDRVMLDFKSPNQELRHNARENNVLHIIAYFLDNRSPTLLDSLKGDFGQCTDGQEEETKQDVKTFIESALTTLIGLVGGSFTRLAQQNIGKKSHPWLDKEDFLRLLSELCVGDRLEFKRRVLYRHWGIFFGQLKDTLLVFHFSPYGSGNKYLIKLTSGSESLAKDQPEYRTDSVEKPLGSHRVRINNSRDGPTPWEPLKPDDIIKNIIERLAEQSCGMRPEYSVLKNNCEHLVNRLRYRQNHSDQVCRIPVLGRYYRA